MGQRPGHCKRLMEGAKLLMADFEGTAVVMGYWKVRKLVHAKGGVVEMGNVDFDMPFLFWLNFCGNQGM